MQTLTRAARTRPAELPETGPAAATTRPRPFAEIAGAYWSDEPRGSALDYLRALPPCELETVSERHQFACPLPNLLDIALEGSRPEAATGR